MFHGETRAYGRLLILCVMVGLVAGIGAIAFYHLLELARGLFWGHLAGYHPPTAGYEKPLYHFGSGGHLRRWVLVLLPAIGGLASGILVFSFAPEAEGHGTDAAIEAYHFRGGLVRARVPLVKAIASAITIGTGGSAGREGPIAQIGSGFGSTLARMVGLPQRERRILMAAGMGAGIGAIFHAPLAGALFAAEVLYKELDIEHEVLVPTFIATIVAYAVFGTVMGFHPLFITPPYGFADARLLLPFLLLAAVCAAGAALYVTAFYTTRRLFRRCPILPNVLKPAIGGLFVGLIGLGLPESLGTGYGILQLSFDDNVLGLTSASRFARLLPEGLSPMTVAWIFLLVIGLAKIATTSLTVGSGGSGGVFGPAIVIGGALGGATGLFCRQVFGGLPIQPGAFALVGMAGFFAAAANTPISTIIMVSEMTGNYDLLVPSMLVCIVAYILCRRFSLYEKQLPSRFEAPAHIGNMAAAVLRQITVRQAAAGKRDGTCVIVSQDMGFRDLLARFSQTSQACLPVVDACGRLTGSIDTRDIRRVVGESGLDDVIIARDIEAPAVTVTPADSLLTAMRRMTAHQCDELVVVDERDPKRPIGTLSRSEIVTAYDRQIIGRAS